MTARTNHTVLAKVTSHKSGGRADVLSGHPAISVGSPVWTDPALTSNRFWKFEVGAVVTVKIKLSGRRRLIQWVTMEPDVQTISAFQRVYKDELDKQARRYAMVHGSAASEPVVAPSYEEAAVDEAQESTAAKVVGDWAERIYVRPEDNKLFNTIHKLAARRHVAVMMIGPSGYGKTSVPEQKAKDWEMEFIRWDCATVRDPEEFFGYRGAVDGSTMSADGETFFAASEFTKAVEAGNTVIVLDELNRIDPYISNILFPLLDHAGRTNVAGHEIVVGPNTIFVATVNIGFQFTGTFQLDTALTNRFTAKVLVGPLPDHIEAQVLMGRSDVDSVQAERIVRLMTSLRQMNNDGSLSVDASTRVSIQIAELVSCGLTLKEAVVYTVINGVSDEEAKAIVDKVRLI